MDASFVKSPTGHLVKTMSGVSAFIPAPLPPQWQEARHFRAATEAASALGELAGATRRLPNPALLLRPLQSREALTSSAIEGTYSNEENLALLDAGAGVEPRDDTREVQNYAIALKAALAHIEDGGSISQLLIRAIHKQLLEGARGAAPGVVPGEYKSEQNFIGGRRGRIDLARFIPPPPLAAADAMAELERYLAKPPELRPHPLIDAALVHYQFETIHPFADGNGRVGRILIPLILKKGGLPGADLLYVSPFIEKSRDDYISLMYDVSRVGAWDDWINYFLRAVRASAETAIAAADRLRALHDDYAKLAVEHSQSGNLRRLVDMLFESPVVTIPAVKRVLRVTYPTAQALTEKLVGAGVLTEVLQKPARTFIAIRIVRVASQDA